MVPRHTFSLTTGYSFYDICSWIDRLTLNAGVSVTGPIYWYEDNQAKQNPYALVNLRISINKGCSKGKTHYLRYISQHQSLTKRYESHAYKQAFTAFPENTEPQYIFLPIHCTSHPDEFLLYSHTSTNEASRLLSFFHRLITTHQTPLDIEVSLGTACRPALYHPKRL